MSELIRLASTEAYHHEWLREAVIRKCKSSDITDDKPAGEQQWCLYSRKNPDKLLGRHPSKESAERQERAIQANK